MNGTGDPFVPNEDRAKDGGGAVATGQNVPAERAEPHANPPRPTETEQNVTPHAATPESQAHPKSQANPEDQAKPEDQTKPNGENEAALNARIAQLEAEVATLKDQALRSVAEAQNVQKRARAQIEQERKFAAEALLRDLIPVLDNFDRSLAAVEKGASLDSVVGGLRTVDKQLRTTLERAGLKRVESVGAPFDPAHHEAIVTHESLEHPDNTVLDEIEAGYVLNERLLRPARVRVSKRPD